MTIIFEFKGGSYDGAVYRSDSLNQEESEWAGRFYRLTGEGTVGKRFRGVSEATQQQMMLEPHSVGHVNQFYEVTNRCEDGDEIHIVCTYIEPSDR